MDKKQAQQLIQQLFTRVFDREHYQNFLLNLLNRIEPGSRGGRQYTGNMIPDAFSGHVNQYWCLGKYVDPEGNELDLLVVEVKTFSKLERARSALRNFAVNRLKQFEKEASLIAFYAQDDKGADWRFSFVKIEHGAYKDEKGKVKIKQELTPARRHSFLVGVHENSHTACRQLLPLLEMDYADPKIEEIEAAFSIEKVTNEFFDQYKALFVRLAEHLKKQPFFRQATVEETDQAVSRFAKKLLGQIVFLYFLQKKGWLGVAKDKAWGDGSRRFMQEQYDQVTGRGGNYFRDFLQYLFYEALADDRKSQADPGYYQRFNCRVPFLNGGLFEADYDWQNESIDIPNDLFRNIDKTKAGDDGTGILDVFGRYNFTIKEDEPLDKEVAVDPEMLGKVFENMLEITERKSKGAFYTPREIVHYMCQESLVNYLHTELNRTQRGPGAEQNSLFVAAGDEKQVSREDLEILVRKGHLFVENDEAALLALQRIEEGKQKTTGKKVELPEAVKNKAALLDEKLATIKVCDPAIGSGAFPVGLLHEIVTARLALAPHSGNRQTPYQLKRHAIAHSIYGVDIDPSAIDIARLRLWLSLIVDEDNYDDIAALPNLDYKIMQGNSLVEEYCGVKLFNEEFIKEDDRNEAKIEQLKEQQAAIQREFIALHSADKLTPEKKRLLEKEAQNFEKKIKTLRAANGKDPRLGLFDVISEAKRKANQLEQLHKDFFAASSPQKKQEIRSRITDLEWELIEATLTERNQQDLLEKLEDVRKSGEKPFFLWKLNFSEIFKEKGGFDVVIGNPPYGVKFAAHVKKELSGYYPPAKKVPDSYSFFLIKGGMLLRENGNLSYIVPNTFCDLENGEEFRQHLLTNYAFKLIWQSGWVFSSAVVDTIVVMLKKESPSIQHETVILTDKSLEFRAQKKFLDVPLCKIDFRTPQLLLDLRRRIQGSTLPLSSFFHIKAGVKIYEVGKGEPPQTKEIVSSKPFSIKGSAPKDWRPLYRGSDISPYMLLDSGERIHYGTWLAAPRSPELFEPPKILMRRTDDRLRSCLDNTNAVCVNSCHVIKVLDESKYKNTSFYFFVMAILNSEMSQWIFEIDNPQMIGKTFAEIKVVYVERLRIPKFDDIHIDILCHFSKFVFFMLNTLFHKKHTPLVSSFLKQLIDALVYELYFPDEIKAANKEILPHLGQLTPISEKMTTEENLAVIQTEFDRLYDPRHPVRNHLETLDSVEVVKTIREALKR